MDILMGMLQLMVVPALCLFVWAVEGQAVWMQYRCIVCTYQMLNNNKLSKKVNIMSRVDVSLSAGSVYVEYGINSMVDVEIKEIEICEIVTEVGEVAILEGIDNEKIKEYLIDEGYEFTEE